MNKNNTCCLLANVVLLDYFLYKYNKNTLILRASFNFHITVLFGIASDPNKARYMDFTEKDQLWCSPQTKRFLWFVNCTSTTIATTLYHNCKLTPTEDLYNTTFNGIVYNTYNYNIFRLLNICLVIAMEPQGQVCAVFDRRRCSLPRPGCQSCCSPCREGLGLPNSP
jgi:hypothetical protein